MSDTINQSNRDTYYILTIEIFNGNVYFFKGPSNSEPEVIKDQLNPEEFTKAVSEAYRFDCLEDIVSSMETLLRPVLKNTGIKEVWVQQVEIQAMFHKTFRFSDIYEMIEEDKEC